MGFGSNPFNKRKAFDTYGAGQGVYLTNELKESDAYRVLTPSGKLVLQEMIRAYYQASNYDKADISHTGFIFTYSQCLEDVDETTFRKARKTLCAKGFFRKAPHLKELRPGAPDRYLPSTEWRAYVPSARECQARQRREQRKKASIARAKRRRADFCAQELKTVSSTKRGGRNSRDTTG